MAVRKLTLRLDDENPLHNKAWTKIEASGKSQQGYLLEAVLAYEHDPLKGLPEADIDKIAERIISRLEQAGAVIGSALSEEPLPQEEPQYDKTNDETKDNLVPDNISKFLLEL